MIKNRLSEEVKYLVASKADIKQFSDIAKHLQLPTKKLILYVPTWSNSTYLILVTTLEFKEVFPRYEDKVFIMFQALNIGANDYKMCWTRSLLTKMIICKQWLWKLTQSLRSIGGKCDLFMAVVAILDPRFKMMLV